MKMSEVKKIARADLAFADLEQKHIGHLKETEGAGSLVFVINGEVFSTSYAPADGQKWHRITGYQANRIINSGDYFEVDTTGII